MKRTIVLAAVVLFCAGALAAAADPLLGAWKLNKDKSTFLNNPGPQSYLCTYADLGGGKIRFTADVVTAEGEKLRPTWEGRRDGKEVPFTGTPSYDSIINYPSKDGASGSWVAKKDGKQLHKGEWRLSPDGKTLTWEFQRTSPEGIIRNKWVLEKQ